ncbi:MAG: hypothetical protein K1X83_05155 [Oligoflexia bacterium]|nr:hypothetical protein [Oligoflexia bacterium]
MGTIREHRAKTGTVTFTATLWEIGHPTACETFSRKSDAKAWLIQEKAKIQQGLYLDVGQAHKHTVGEAIDRY